MVSLIDDILLETESKVEHDNSVEEVLTRIEVDNLYIKLEKCKWKVREVGFLRVAIGLDGIKMKKEKCKGSVGLTSA